ncbi:hypothetical protein ElyMa_006503800 [Elysia marginata]|uniref:Reverse transcriptase domain-containing protein n=1 Tax=Elysia marginata TaxID=1093978 RepID=A0AAV4I4D5_9GAST|nr:hypothetical protein ElyMa_006503800 [Elysia marginata]
MGRPHPSKQRHEKRSKGLITLFYESLGQDKNNLHGLKKDRETLDDCEALSKTTIKDRLELRYADDTALLSKTTEGLNEIMQNVKKFSQNKNFLLNAKKTKVMDSDKSPASSILLDNEALKNVTHFNYLGANIEAKGKITPDIRKRLAIATSKLKSMMNIWKSQSTPLEMRILKSCIFPVATYGCKTWTLTKKM